MIASPAAVSMELFLSCPMDIAARLAIIPKKIQNIQNR